MNTAVFSQGDLGFSGTFEFKEDSKLAEVPVEMKDFDGTAKTFEVSLAIQTCSADAVCPAKKVDLLL